MFPCNDLDAISDSSGIAAQVASNIRELQTVALVSEEKKNGRCVPQARHCGTNYRLTIRHVDPINRSRLRTERRVTGHRYPVRCLPQSFIKVEYLCTITFQGDWESLRLAEKFFPGRDGQ